MVCAMTPATIIDRLGGVSAVSARCGIPVNTVGNWKIRQSVPARYHAILLDMAADLSVALTAEDIVRAHSEAAR